MKNPIISKICSTILIICLFVTNAITLKLYLNTFTTNETIQIEDTGDEISRAKLFIKDWYDELDESFGNVKVYNNELQFQSGTYTLTVAADRIRAVYPRGVRFFKMEYISYIEFFMENENLSCKLYYNESGESIYKIN